MKREIFMGVFYVNCNKNQRRDDPQMILRDIGDEKYRIAYITKAAPDIKYSLKKLLAVAITVIATLTVIAANALATVPCRGIFYRTACRQKE